MTVARIRIDVTGIDDVERGIIPALAGTTM